MIAPKRLTSRARRDKRRAHDALRPSAQATCPQCNAPRRPHHVCGQCGFYRDRTVIETDED